MDARSSAAWIPRPEWKQRLFGQTGDFGVESINAGRLVGSPFGGDRRSCGNPRHSVDGLNAALIEDLGEMRLAQVSTPLVAATYDANSGSPLLFASREASGSVAAHDLPLRAGHFGCATFFPALERAWAEVVDQNIAGALDDPSKERLDAPTTNTGKTPPTGSLTRFGGQITDSAKVGLATELRYREKGNGHDVVE